MGEESRNDFTLIMRRGKLSDLTDVNEAVTFSDQGPLSPLSLPDPPSVLSPEMSEYGYDMREEVLECTYDRQKCFNTNFRLTLSKRHGNCLTFNSKYRSPPARLST